MADNRPLTDKERENILKLYQKDIPVRDIVSITCVSPSTVSRLVNLYKAATGNGSWKEESSKAGMAPHIEFVKKFTNFDEPKEEDSCTGLEALIHAIDIQTANIIRELTYIEAILNEMSGKEHNNGI